MNQKNWEFKNKLAQYYTAHHKAVFLEDVNVKEMLKGSQNARSKAESGAASSVFSNTMVKNGCYVVTVNPENTTLDCALCGTSVYKRLSVRERSCPTCGFETGRGGEGLECGVERPLTRTKEARSRSGSDSLRRNACGKCNRCVR
jgi:Putative transposase DNA-binding domain.